MDCEVFHCKKSYKTNSSFFIFSTDMGIEMNKLLLMPSVYHLTKLKNAFLINNRWQHCSCTSHHLFIIQLSLKSSFLKITIDGSTAIAAESCKFSTDMGIEVNKLHLTPSVYHLTKLKNSFFKVNNR